MTQERRQGTGLAALVDPLVVLAFGGQDREAHPLARGRLDAIVLVVLAKQVAGDPEQPRGTRAVRLVPEPARRVPGLRERLSGQIQARRFRAGVPDEPRADPDRVAVIELAERLRIFAGRFEQLGVSSGQKVRRLSRRFAQTIMNAAPAGSLKRVRR